jgi:stage V sporulation protein G
VEITEVRIKLTENSDDRLQAFCSITFDDCFVVRDLKIIEGAGGPFVAMPSRKLAGHCPHCGAKNHLRAAWCNDCGGQLDAGGAARDRDGRPRLYADIAHPIDSTCREMIQARVIAAYRAEREQARQPGYVSKYSDDYHDDFDYDEIAHEKQSRIEPAERAPRPHHLSGAGKKPNGAGHRRVGDGFGAGVF